MTSSCGDAVRRSATWLTMPMVRPPLASVDHVEDLLERVLVEAAETLVDEHRVDGDAAGLAPTMSATPRARAAT
jgi:hypothetical protein